MKKQLNDQLEQEARESGRLSADDIKKPEPIQGESDQAEKLPGNMKSEDTKPEAASDQKRIEEKKDNTTTSEPDQIDITQILAEAPEDEKGNKIIPDHIFEKYYRQLPNGTRNKSRSMIAVNGGILKPLGADPERDKEIHRAGADALNAKHAQRQTLSETLDVLLRKKATQADIDAYNLPSDATYQDAIMAAMMQQAAEGNVKAGQFIRDTIGEQPTAKQDLNVSMSDADKALLDKVQARLGIKEE